MTYESMIIVLLSTQMILFFICVLTELGLFSVWAIFFATAMQILIYLLTIIDDTTGD